MSEVALEQLVRSGHALAGRVRALASPRLRIALMNAGTRLAFDRRLRAQTDGWIELAELGLPSEHRIHYQPSPWLTLPRAIRRAEVSPHDVFIDFGCGMGRMVLEAALLYPFDRVIGVELSEELVRIARGNVDRNRRRLAARDVELVVSDVLDYQVPDDVTVAFFYNPFLGPIFDHVLRQLLASVDRAPRRLRIIYRNPVEEPMLLATGRIRRVGSGRSFTRRNREQAGLAIYEVDPA